jgi:hypothetical protein
VKEHISHPYKTKCNISVFWFFESILNKIWIKLQQAFPEIWYFLQFKIAFNQSVDWTQASYSRDQTSRGINMAGMPSWNSFIQALPYDFSSWLLWVTVSQIAPKRLLPSKPKNYSIFSQLVKMMFNQNPKVS